MPRSLALLSWLCLTTVFATAANADWAELVGKPVPDVEGEVWFRRSEGYDPQQLEGFVVLTVLWDVAHGEPLVPVLNELRDRYHSNGLRIVAITKDPVKDVEAFEKKVRPYFTTMVVKKYDGFGSGPMPHAFLLDAASNVIWDGDPDATPHKLLVTTLRKANPCVMEPPHALLKTAAKLFEKGKLGEAAGDALATIPWAKGYFNAKTAKGRRIIASITSGAKFIASRVSVRHRYWWRLAKESEASGDFQKAIYALKLVQKHFDEEHYRADDFKLPQGDSARAKAELKRLRKQTDVKRELRFAKTVVAFAKKQDHMKWTAKSKASYVRRLEDLIEAAKGTYSAQRAQRLLGFAQAVVVKG